MIKQILWSSAGVLLAAGMLAAGFVAGQPGAAQAQAQPPAQAAPAAAELDRKQIETIVREYLVANPEILVEMQDALEGKQKEEQRIAHLAVLKDAKEEIFASKFDGVVGNPNGKITIVEFYDYNCGFCKRAQEDMLALTAADPDLRFVLKELPILGPDSQKAHVVSQAFHRLVPEKYAEFHNALMSDPGRAGEASAIKLAVSLGADEAKLREAMKDPSINEVFSKTYDLANKLSITGTPSYVVGDEIVYGALGQEVLSEKIAAAKQACAAAAC